MKRKITYTLLIIILLGGLYLGLRLAFGLFTQFNFWTARQDIKNGKILIAEIGEMPLNFEKKQKLANSFGFNFYLFGCNVSKDIINGTEYYNKEMVVHLESKFGSKWWMKFQNQLDSIDNAEKKQTVTSTKRLSFKNISEIVADNSYSTWVNLQDINASLALHFQNKDTLAVSYSTECWLMFPYKLIQNKIVVYWDNNVDTKYNFDIVKAVNQTDKKYLGQPFMILELENETTFKASYPLKELIRKINSSSKEREFFSDKYEIVKDGFL